MANHKTILSMISLYTKFPSHVGKCIVIRNYSKHYKPEWKWHRTQKVIKVELPDFHKDNDPDQLTTEQMRSKLKERGVDPPRYWTDRPMYISCTGGIFEPYVPPEGDGKMSFITKAGAKQKYDLIEKKSKSMLAIRKIRSFDEDFEIDEFEREVHDIYINAHNALLTKDPENLMLYVTERGIPEMMNNIKNKSLRWKFIKSIEPPKVVHARYTDIVTKMNIYAQITVRFHTEQMLAIYDRFGRLMHGSEILAKDVLEYIVFEKHLSNVYGKWRLHDKVVPDWMPLPEASSRTYRADILPPLPAASDAANAEVVQAEPTPAVA